MRSKRLWHAMFLVVAWGLTGRVSRADENFSGTYHIPAGAGPALTLMLQQDAQGHATGTLDNGQMKFTVEGNLMQEGENKGKMLVGSLRSGQAAMFFATQKQPAGQLEFVFIQPGADGKPDLQKVNTVVFPVPGGTPGGGPGGTTPPGAAPANTTPGAGNAGGTYSGNYSMEGAKGTITLALQQGDGGKVTGSLSGGGVSFQLKGQVLDDGPNRGTVSGAAYGADGKFTSFIQAEHQGGKIALSLIGANAQGDPDPNQKSQFTFTSTDGNGDTVPANNNGNNGNAGAGANAFAGTFKNAEMTVESQGQGGHYTGTIKFNGQTFKFMGDAGATGLEGNFESKDGQFPFTATLNGATLTLTTAGTVYNLTKQNLNPLANPLAKPQSANPLAKPPAVNPLSKPQAANPLSGATRTPVSTKPPATQRPAIPTVQTTQTRPTSPAPLVAAWKTFKHPIGLTMRYPADWTLKELQGAIQLVPPNAGTSPQGPTEVYLVSGQPAGDITSTQDPRFAQAIEAIVGQLFPFLHRVGETESVSAATAPGLAMQWEGTNQVGMAVRAQVFSTLLKGFGLSVIAVGNKQLVTAREKTTRAIFTSLGAFEGQKDPQLVGNWSTQVVDNGMIVRDAANRISTTSAADSSTRYTLTGDGTVTKVTHSRTIVNAPGVSLDSGDNYETTRGSWSAGEGKLVVFWENGSTNEWTYQAAANDGQGRRILLRSGNSAVMLVGG